MVLRNYENVLIKIAPNYREWGRNIPLPVILFYVNGTNNTQ